MFVNYSIQSLADVLCMYYISIINRYFKDVREILRFLLTMVIVFASVQLVNERFAFLGRGHLWTVPLLIFIIRLNIVSI